MTVVTNGVGYHGLNMAATAVVFAVVLSPEGRYRSVHAGPGHRKGPAPG